MKTKHHPPVLIFHFNKTVSECKLTVFRRERGAGFTEQGLAERTVQRSTQKRVHYGESIVENYNTNSFSTAIILWYSI